MKQNKGLIELRNIGHKIAGRLNETGIFSEDELHMVGAVKGHNNDKSPRP